MISLSLNENIIEDYQVSIIQPNINLSDKRDFTKRFINIDNLTYAGNLENLDSQKENKKHLFIEGDISDSIKLTTVLHSHPNGANSYRLELGNTVIVYCTDIEHPEGRLNQNAIEIAKDADVLIKDAHFTDEELPMHKGWGHSSWQQATAVAEKESVKQLVLFHHSPTHDDDDVREIEENAQAVFKNTIAAREGLEIKLPV